METKELQRYLSAYLSTDEITDWYKVTTEQLKRADTEQTFKLERPKHTYVDGHAVAINSDENRVLWSLFWFAYLHNECSDKNQAPTIREYILTGDIVLDERTLPLSNAPLSQPYSDVFASENIKEMCDRGYYDYFDIKVRNPLCTLPDKWDEVKFQLFCTESLDYHLLLKLRAQPRVFEPANARTVIIKQMKIGVLFQEIEKLRKWLGMPCDLNEQMKTKIAKLGGYVPGVEVL